MGGGLLQLVAQGSQDVYLTGNPQITFFKIVYRRHTAFSKECIEQTFSGTVGLDKRVNCVISRNGDLVQEIYFRFKGTSAITSPAAHEASDGTNILKTVKLEIGGQEIDKHYAEWLDIYNDLYVSDEEHAYRFVLSQGDTEEHVVPLRFWFCRNPGLALPLIALQYHEVKVEVEINSTFGFSGSSTTVTDASLLVNYIYLDTDERRRFAQVSHEYLIEQVQHTGSEALTQNANNKIRLNYNHPVKLLAWRLMTGTLKEGKLQLNGHDRFATRDADYFHLVQPMEHGMGQSKALDYAGRTYSAVARHTAADAQNTFMYSFCLRPKEHQPSGTCNFSRIDNAVLQLTENNTAAGTVHIFAVNYNVLRIMSGMGGLAYSS
jgi:hypothetical protein